MDYIIITIIRNLFSQEVEEEEEEDETAFDFQVVVI
jgi:hypothetical protein